MMLDHAITAAERTETARPLITQAQVEIVNLVTLSAIELCVLDGSPQPGTQRPGGDYGLKPELGRMLAARCRPSFIVIAAEERRGLHQLSLFALGDQAQPVRGIVGELPAPLPAGSPNPRRLGPLGWIYRYVLVSPSRAEYDLGALRAIMLELLAETAR
jgi:hypothetical protein